MIKIRIVITDEGEKHVKKIWKNRYQILEEKGSGGNGKVYRVWDLHLEKEWAMKILEENIFWVGGQEKDERMDELAALKKISHPNFPRIVDAFEEERKNILIMDYIKGVTLDAMIRKGAFREEEMIPVLLQICDAILYLHQSTPPLLYLDLKPANIILEENNHVRLVDLGSAYVCFKDKKQRISGTKYFAPKEQCGQRKDKNAGTPDVRTDIYAFGMTLYYLLTGGKKEQRRGGKLCIKDVNPSVSWGMSHIIEKCTMEKPEQRYQSMEEVLEQLQHVRRIGRQKESKIRIQRGAVSACKIVCAFLVLYFAYCHQYKEVMAYLDMWNSFFAALP